MANLIAKTHFFDKRKRDRLETAVVVGLVGVGLAACIIAACVFDIIHVFSAW
jgi:hypothetical protein